MLEEIKELVYQACHNEKNPFGPHAWDTHILPVVNYAKIMAKKLDADEEVVEIAAYLHDYANIIKTGNEKDHHVKGAELAFQILSKYNYPEAKKKISLRCYLFASCQSINRKENQRRSLCG